MKPRVSRITVSRNRMSFSGPAAMMAFKAMTEPKPVRRFTSVAVWPNGTLCDGLDISTDTHATREQAEAVCSLLAKEGLGGEGKIFPLSTRVEEAATQF